MKTPRSRHRLVEDDIALVMHVLKKIVGHGWKLVNVDSQLPNIYITVHNPILVGPPLAPLTINLEDVVSSTNMPKLD